MIFLIGRESYKGYWNFFEAKKQTELFVCRILGHYLGKDEFDRSRLKEETLT